MRNLSRPTLIALVLFGLVLLLLFGFWLSQRGQPDQDRLSDEQIEQGASPLDDAEKRCGSQRSYELIKRELFRRAAELRGSDRAAFDQLTAAASVRMESPSVTARDAALGSVSCSGHLSLDLPPGVAVVGGRRTLQADINYRLQPAADDSGEVLFLEGADAILVPLATLASITRPADRGELAPPIADADEQPVPVVAEVPQPQVVRPAEPSRPIARPSYDCRNARTSSEIAVCNSPTLAALDRQMAAQYGSAVASADPQRRNWLAATRLSFLRYRDRCRTSACIADAYRGRMREIDDIMSGRWRPGR